MAERLRAFLERPLDPRAGQAALALTAAILLGFATLVVLAGDGDPRPPTSNLPTAPAARPGTVPLRPSPVRVEPPPHRSRPRAPQDPQDDRGSAAAQRAERELRTHSALQHVPYRRARLSIQLVGAKGRQAVLAVSAPTLSAGRGGWRRFLRRYRDSGRAYIPRFRADGGVGG